MVGEADLGLYAHAVLWENESGPEILWDYVGIANDINNDGDVVGYSLSELGGPNCAVLWTMSEGLQCLGVPENYSVDNAGNAIAINNVDQIAGQLSDGNDVNHAILWSSAGVPQELGDLGGGQSGAYGINDTGQVVGYSATSSGASHAFVWTSNDGMLDLNNLIDSGDPLSGQIELSEAQDINDSGQIVANGTLKATGEARAFLLTPIETGQELSVSFQGLALRRAGCDNLTTGQKVTVPVQPGIKLADCSEVGLAVSAGDKVGVRLSGTVPSYTRFLKATANGFTLKSAICENQRTKQKVRVRLNPGATVADCTAAGFRIRPRDSIIVQLIGFVSAQLPEGNSANQGWLDAQG